eukprot:gene10838-10994_t
MSDLRVDCKAIERSYLNAEEDREVWNVSSVWHRSAKGASKKLTTVDDAGSGVARIVNGVIAIFEAKTMSEERKSVEIFTQSLVWDGPPIRISNKGHLRLAAYLFKYFAHLSIIPVAVAASQPSPGRHLLELDAVAVSRPHRSWLVPISMLLPAEVPKNVHFKIGVKGSLEAGQVELFTGRITNLPPFAPLLVRVLAGILMGAVPHAFEEVLGFAFDFADGSSYYAQKRNETFKRRHPDSQNPTWDYAQDVLYDTKDWVQQQAVVGYESLQAVFGKTFTNIHDIVQSVISFYIWVLSSIWNIISSGFGAVGDLLGSAAPTDSTYSVTPAGQGARVYRDPYLTSAAVPGRS